VILVYSKVIASWKWMKIKKKFDIFWNFITKKGRMRFRLLKNVWCLWTWCNISTCGTNTCGIKLIQAFSIWKFWCQRCILLWSINHWKVDEIMEKVEQDGHISSHDIDKKRLQNSFKSFKFGEDWIQKKTRCLDVTWFNSEKCNGSNFHLQIIVKTERN